MKLKTRFAPTPSGYLHLGNVLNALWCKKWAKDNNASLILRIDDIDRERFRKEYLEDIFKTLDWIGVCFDEGASGVEDFLENYSQHKKLDKYQDYLSKVNSQTFSCECSRKDLLGKDIYPGTCESKNLSYEVGRNLRLLPESIVIYKKDLLPSYQWTCVIDDHEMEITHAIRGEDLRESSSTQEKLRRQLNLDPIETIHHGLIKNKAGEKLSKSTMKNGASIRNTYSISEIKKIFSEFYQRP